MYLKDSLGFLTNEEEQELSSWWNKVTWKLSNAPAANLSALVVISLQNVTLVVECNFWIWVPKKEHGAMKAVDKFDYTVDPSFLPTRLGGSVRPSLKAQTKRTIPIPVRRWKPSSSCGSWTKFWQELNKTQHLNKLLERAWIWHQTRVRKSWRLVQEPVSLETQSRYLGDFITFSDWKSSRLHHSCGTTQQLMKSSILRQIEKKMPKCASCFGLDDGKMRTLRCGESSPTWPVNGSVRSVAPSANSAIQAEANHCVWDLERLKKILRSF